jgi:hypothetical protein
MLIASVCGDLNHPHKQGLPASEAGKDTLESNPDTAARLAKEGKDD